MVKRTFFTHNFLAVVGLVFIVLSGPIFGFLFYSMMFCRTIRVIRFIDGALIVPQDWGLPPCQLRFTVKMDEIKSIAFGHSSGDSDGDWIPGGFSSVPCLNIILKDGMTKRIMMAGFTKKQFCAIEECILSGNPDIEVKMSAQEHIQKYGIYY